jgi:hypothetical protein
MVANGVVKLVLMLTFELDSMLLERVVINVFEDVKVFTMPVPGICKLA